MNAQSIFIILIAVTLIFGFGVVLLNRRRADSKTSGVTPKVPLVPKVPLDPKTPLVQVEHGAPAALVETPGLRGRLGRTASAIASTVTGIRQRGAITDETWVELEEALLRSDIGVQVTTALLDGVRAKVRNKEIVDAEALLSALQDEMVGRLSTGVRDLTTEASSPERMNVWIMVGVNGAGKTTTIGKIAAQQVRHGRKVMLAAGDTFRAAAAEQLETWAERSGADLVRGQEGGDPSAVAFDAVASAAAKGCDVVIVDTAGRLQNKSNLMDELKKVRRVADRLPGEVTEVLLVIDATTGQNGLSQAREFTQAVGVTGVVLTKLDGSAKGGIVFAIETEMGIPVKLVGVGEGIDDLVLFDADEFVTALFAG